MPDSYENALMGNQVIFSSTVTVSYSAILWSLDNSATVYCTDLLKQTSHDGNSDTFKASITSAQIEVVHFAVWIAFKPSK